MWIVLIKKVSQFENININKNSALISPIEITENTNIKNILGKEIYILRMKMKLNWKKHMIMILK